MSFKDQIAPEGFIYVCHACGKTSKDRYGYNKKYPGETSYGWDASCYMYSKMYKKSQLEYDEFKKVSKINEEKDADDTSRI